MPSRGEMGGGQDWNTVSFSSKPSSSQSAGNKAQNLKDAQRSGGQIDTSKKQGGGGNKQVTAAGLNAARLENEDEELSRELLPARPPEPLPEPAPSQSALAPQARRGTGVGHGCLGAGGACPVRARHRLLLPCHADAKVPTDLKVAIQKARAAKGLTQKQLAQQLNMQPQVINEYESGKGVPNNAINAKIEKALGAKLPRVPKK